MQAHASALASPRRPEPPRRTTAPPASPSASSTRSELAPTLRYYETDAAAAQFDYGVDDPSLLPEQPDAGALEPDATVDDDSYYTGGAYYYVQPADDDQE